jgi:hypothetical protein
MKDNIRPTKEILQKQNLQEDNNAKELCLPDQRSYVFTLEKVRVPKTMPSPWITFSVFEENYRKFKY